MALTTLFEMRQGQTPIEPETYRGAEQRGEAVSQQFRPKRGGRPDSYQGGELANEQAAKDAPLITPTFDPIDIVPPYIEDPAATLALWAMKEFPLNPDEQALAKRGELGPPRASDTMPSLGKFEPGTATQVIVACEKKSGDHHGAGMVSEREEPAAAVGHVRQWYTTGQQQ